MNTEIQDEEVMEYIIGTKRYPIALPCYELLSDSSIRLLNENESVDTLDLLTIREYIPKLLSILVAKDLSELLDRLDEGGSKSNVQIFQIIASFIAEKKNIIWLKKDDAVVVGVYEEIDGAKRVIHCDYFRSCILSPELDLLSVLINIASFKLM